MEVFAWVPADPRPGRPGDPGPGSGDNDSLGSCLLAHASLSAHHRTIIMIFLLT